MKFRTDFAGKPCLGSHVPLTPQEFVDGMNTLALFHGPGGLWREYEVRLLVLRELGPWPCHCCAFTLAVRAARSIARRDGFANQ
jgi:hypothetical protein